MVFSVLVLIAPQPVYFDLYRKGNIVIKTMNISFNFSYSVVETNREILYVAKAYESLSPLLTSRSPESHEPCFYMLYNIL